MPGGAPEPIILAMTTSSPVPTAAPKTAPTALATPIRRFRIARMPLTGRPQIIVAAKPS